jgi:NADH-quinone oxidoreductase subunit G
MCAATARLEAASWGEAFGAIADGCFGAKPERIGAIAGDLAASKKCTRSRR